MQRSGPSTSCSDSSPCARALAARALAAQHVSPEQIRWRVDAELVARKTSGG
jgi:hypothetical protein